MLAAPSFPMLLNYTHKVSCVRFLRVEIACAMLAAASFTMPVLIRSRVSYARFVRFESD